MVHELMLKPIHDRIYKNIYVFSDNEDNSDDIDKRYKNISNGFKHFLREKLRLNNGKEVEDEIGS